MKCNYCGVEHQDWLEHTSYEHLGVKACLVSLKRSEVVKAEGTNDKVMAVWSDAARKASAEARKASADAHSATTRGIFMAKDLAKEHSKAAEAHRVAAGQMLKDSSEREIKGEQFSDSEKQEWTKHFLSHRLQQEQHQKHADYLNASDATSADVVHCRATSSVGPALGASAAWEVGVPVSFMFMPAGTHTITAGFRKGSIELTVQCDESTAKAVQASLDAWRAERPKQQPFGCIEHREHEASVCVSASCGFEWKEDGVYLAAEPTSLGANNVNGKVHRSWSPSFTTDADYAKATEDGGTLRFPEGVRGSRSNPAQITGVDFCVGTLTNRPAFVEMKPVKAREADAVTAAGTSEGAKKGWEHRAGLANAATEAAKRSEKSAIDAPSFESHNAASDAHWYASKKHRDAAIEAHREGKNTEELDHQTKSDEHIKKSDFHAVESFSVGAKHREVESYKRLKQALANRATSATPSDALHVRSQAPSPFNTVLAREADADAILDKIVARNKPKPVTVDQINAKFGQTKTGDTRKTPDEILAGIYARAGLSR